MTDTTAPTPASRTPRNNTLRLLAMGVAFGIVGGLVGLKIGSWLKVQGPPGRGHLALTTTEEVILAVVVVLALHLVLLAHELGHLIGGRLVGFRAFLLIVGPIRLERGASGWHLHRNTSAALWGGLAGSAPTDTENLRARSAIMIAGGPVASLLVGAAGLTLWFALDPTSIGAATPFGTVLLSYSALAAGGTSLAVAAATLIPMHTAGFLSDGARLWRLITQGEVGGRDTALQAIVSQSLAGTRPRDWSPELIETVLSLRDGSPFEFSAWQFAQMHALDTGHEADAHKWLEVMVAGVDRMPPTFQAGVRLEAARQMALRGEIAAAERLAGEANGPVMFAPYARALVQATLLTVTGRGVDALPMLPGIRTQLSGNIDRGAAIMLLEAVDRLEAQARQSGARN